ncbi:MAG: RNA 2',3'-cyclic phosphodiesterase [Mobilicoccus sp.]|nr:RNA 2',3'-cyclic phosphodiesterase [Mobilicoccus sp.]
MRAFVSIPVPLEAREHLADHLEPRLGEACLRWSDPERWHLTLAFMPDLSEVDLDDLTERLTEAGTRRRPFTMRLRGANTFGPPTRARVLWADIEADAEDREELDRLAVGCRHAAAASGTVVEGGRFVPHVTLARCPRPRDLTRLLQVFDLYEGPTWQVESVDLVESHLHPTRHDVLTTVSLGNPDEVQEHRWWRRAP